MPRFNVEHDGVWACFSTISDSFVTTFAEKEDYEAWRLEEYGNANYKPAEECNCMSLKEAVFSIRLNRNYEDSVYCLMESGLDKSECEELVSAAENEHYCPKLHADGKYTCPNCGHEVEKNQKECEVEHCGLKFVWCVV